ncbi:hypothetical protein WK22_00830 [Burkholderia multivorans]|uniref:DUF6285 domain-containing protein n=1 Tax=Burkholderia multivorans TaxID=87883 RepID=UPI000841FC2C|nr:DUF6285 domain-containing protein [Burkholderia multivorans]AOJ91571.1 hypothetical protein WK22_00830 [Burkholderia multivorans]
MNGTQKILDLLEVAHSTLTNDVVPSLSKQERYNSLMVANAIRIAARHFCATQERQTKAPASGLLGEGTIAQAIRAGQFDAGSTMRASLIVNLRSRLVQQLAIDNPRALDNIQNSPQAH